MISDITFNGNYFFSDYVKGDNSLSSPHNIHDCIRYLLSLT